MTALTSKVVRLWKEATYDLSENVYREVKTKQHLRDVSSSRISPLQMPNLIVGCYYPQILMLYHTFNEAKSRRNSSVELGHRLKIMQFEWMKTRQGGMMGMAKDLLLWLASQGAATEGEVNAYFNRDGSSFWDSTGKSSYSPRDVVLAETELDGKLEAFYSSCNKRLYSFLEQHPDLLLQSSLESINDSFVF